MNWSPQLGFCTEACGHSSEAGGPNPERADPDEECVSLHRWHVSRPLSMSRPESLRLTISTNGRAWIQQEALLRTLIAP
jgi:hypothetical protein